SFSDYEYRIPEEIATSHCDTSWSDPMRNPSSSYPHASSTSFTFPVPSETLLLLSKGGLSGGHLRITTSEGSDVRVNVQVNYYKDAIRDLARVCMTAREDGELGVGIFTPQPWRRRSWTDRLSFDVELIIPRSAHVNALSTDVSNFSQDVESLPGVYFNRLSLKGFNGKIDTEELTAANATLDTSNGSVNAKALVAPRAKVTSSHGGISGSYAVVDSLILHTSNGAIKAAVSITENSGLQTPKEITLRTTNNALDYNLNLGPTSAKAENFIIKTTTSNGKLTGQIASAPLNSVLSIDAQSSNSRAQLTLPPTYEGRFEVATSNAPVQVLVLNDDQPDPACEGKRNCKGRQRAVHTGTVSKRSIMGAVHWDKKNGDRCFVNLKSSNGLTTLYL
ncbi:hypothetical protein R3P38DRAFT_2885863, partial [Favolaschia claudopus]